MEEKCGGLPLAINAVGGLLVKEGLSKSGWMKVLKGINSHLGRNGSIVFGILELSYQALPPRLKSCFLCLSFFKEDATIRAVKLKNIWISLGYIRQEGEERVEAVATRYLDELITRNLIQVKGVSKDGHQIKTCQVHDLIREVCIAKAKEEMGLEILRGKESSSQPSDKPRHRALYTSLIDGESSRNKHLRSLSVCTDVTDAPLSYWKGFELLKILDLEDCVSLEKLPEAIGALIGLTYLGLKNTRVRKLPRSFRKLKNLEVIELPYRAQLPISPNLRHIEGERMDLKVPRKIRHLKTNASGTLSKPSKDSKHGAELQILGTVSVESCTPELFQHASHLKKLGIRGHLALLLEGKKGSLDSLGRMKSLENLKLINDLYPLQHSEGQLNGLPQPDQFPSRLKSLTLRATFLDWSNMSILALLANLEVLKLKDKAFMGATWDALDGGFRHLEFLHIEETDLKVWTASSHHYPRLRGLVLRNCEKLLAVPQGLANTESFKTLELYTCKTAVVSARKVQQAKRKAQAEFRLSVFPPID